MNRVIRTATARNESGLWIKKSNANSSFWLSVHEYPIRSANSFASAIAATGLFPRAMVLFSGLNVNHKIVKVLRFDPRVALYNFA